MTEEKALKKVNLSVKIRPDQKEWLNLHKKITGNSVAEVVIVLIDYYMALNAEEK